MKLKMFLIAYFEQKTRENLQFSKSDSGGQ